MIKLVFALRRRKDMPPEEFHRYWLEEHGPLALGILEPLGLDAMSRPTQSLQS